MVLSIIELKDIYKAYNHFPSISSAYLYSQALSFQWLTWQECIAYIFEPVKSAVIWEMILKTNRKIS